MPDYSFTYYAPSIDPIKITSNDKTRTIAKDISRSEAAKDNEDRGLSSNP